MDEESETRTPPYPHYFSCRISESSRVTHCNTCEAAPVYLARIQELKELLVEALVLAGVNDGLHRGLHKNCAHCSLLEKVANARVHHEG